MQRGVAETVGVRVGAGLQKFRRKLEVRVGHSQIDRRRPGTNGPFSVWKLRVRRHRHRIVHADSGFQQRLDHGDMPLPDRKHQRREPGIERRPEIGAGFHQFLQHVDVAVGSRPHQRRLAPAGFFGVHVGTAGDQRTYGIDLPRACSRHEHRLSAGERCVGIRTGLEQLPDDSGIAVRACDRQRRDAIPVGGADVGAGGEQPVHQVEVVMMSGPVQRRRPVRLRRIDVDPAREQLSDSPAILPLRRIGQLRIRLRAPHCGGQVGGVPTRAAPTKQR